MDRFMALRTAAKVRSEMELRPFSFSGHGGSRMSLAQYVDLTVTLTQKEIKIRYKSNFLGYFWSLVNPLASAIIIFLVIQVILRVEMENYVVFLIIGLFAWQWFNNYLVGSCAVFLSNASLIKKCVFPRFVLPIALDLQDTFHYAMSIPIVLGFVAYHHLPIGSATLLGILAVIPAQFLLLLGFGLILSSANLFLRDVERIVMILLNMMFYLSPVLYPIVLVPEPYRKLMWINPMTPILEAWRGVFLDGVVRWSSVGVAYAYAAIAVMLGVWAYRRLSSRFAEAI
jgi:lipopolysaccharide transport system permease protein